MPLNFCKNNGVLWRKIALFATVVLLLLAGIALFLVFTSKGKGDCDNSCTSKNCLETVKHLAENLNQEIEPCEDFYSFTCGNWIKRYENVTFNMREQMAETMQVSIKEVLLGLESNSYSNSGRLRMFYDSCLDYGASELNAVPSVLKFFKILGMDEWPNLPENFTFVNPLLEETIAILISYNSFPFLEFKRREIDKEYFFHFKVVGKEHPAINGTETILSQIVNYFRASPRDTSTIVKDFISISNEVLTMLPKGTCIENCNYPTVNINCSTLQERPVKLICSVAQYLVKHNGLEDTHSADPLVLENSTPTLILNEMSNYHSHRALANYFALSFLLQHLSVLDNYLRNMKFGSLQNHRFVAGILKSKWEFCTYLMSHFMPQPLAQEYFAKKLPLYKMKEVHAIFEGYKEAADKYINEQDWIDDKTKKSLQINLFNLASSHLLWMKYLDDGTFDRLMDDYHPTNSSFLWNVLDYNKQKFEFQLLKSIPDSAKQIETIFENTAQHRNGLIDLSFGLLVPPIFDYDRPRWMNFAALGFGIAHEVGHNIIHHFKTSETSDESMKKLQGTFLCLVHQYSNFSQAESGRKVDGPRTVEENLADLIAIELMEKAIDIMREKSENFPSICVPDFPYSTQQTFYILLTQYFCENANPEKDDSVDVHANARFRIAGIMQNAEKFSENFQCSESSYMNPGNKCSFFE